MNPGVSVIYPSKIGASEVYTRFATILRNIGKFIGQSRIGKIALRAYPVINRLKITIAQFKCKNAV